MDEQEDARIHLFSLILYSLTGLLFHPLTSWQIVGGKF